MQYDFDQVVDRSKNLSAKYDERVKKFGTDDVIPLWIADMDFRTAQPVIDALKARAEEGIWGYTARPASYFEAVKNWQKRRNGWDTDTALMSFSPGVVQTLSVMIRLYTPQNGNVLIQTPVYGEFYDMTELAGRHVIENQLVEQDGAWTVDWADFEKKLRSADIFLLCNPHNPLGIVWTEEELRRMMELCLKHHVLVVSDEIHSDLIFHGKRHIPTASLSPEIAANVVTGISATKTFNLAGLQASTAVFPNAHMKAMFDKFWTAFIQELVAKTVVKPHESKEQLRSNRIDKFLTGKYTAIPAFIAIMGLVFFLTFNVIGLFFQNLMETGIDALTGIVDTALTNWNVNAAVHSLLIDGIFTGVGSVLSFLPIIVVLFFFLSMLEDTGYMARVAFVMDKLLRRIGLSGRSIVPMLIGFGCTVPGVMASRTLPSERDRKMTILLTPFMSCSAKLPIYSLFAAAFFPQYAGLVMVLLYFTGIAVGVLAALLLKSTVFKGEAVPFVMELPNYRLPGLKNVAQLLWEKARDFLQKAFTVIFAATIVIWFLQNFDLQLRLTADPQASILARIAGDIAPLFGPLGFADWRISTALITGFMAKESVVSSLLILFGSEVALSAALTPAQAAPLLVFCLLYTPCIAAVASVKRELGNKWAVIMVVNQCAVAWLCALLVRLAAVALF